MIGADATGHHQHRIGHHTAIGLIGQFHQGIQRGVKGKGAEEIPLPALLRLVHRHRRRAAGIVHGIGGVGGIGRSGRPIDWPRPRDDSVPAS
jgi:hypothetical protein